MIIVDWVISNSIVSKKKASRSVFLLFSSFFLSHFYLPVYFFLPSKYTPSFDGWLLTQSIWCTRAFTIHERHERFVCQNFIQFKIHDFGHFWIRTYKHTHKKKHSIEYFYCEKKEHECQDRLVCLFVCLASKPRVKTSNNLNNSYPIYHYFEIQLIFNWLGVIQDQCWWWSIHWITVRLLLMWCDVMMMVIYLSLFVFVFTDIYEKLGRVIF